MRSRIPLLTVDCEYLRSAAMVGMAGQHSPFSFVRSARYIYIPQRHGAAVRCGKENQDGSLLCTSVSVKSFMISASVKSGAASFFGGNGTGLRTRNSRRPSLLFFKIVLPGKKSYFMRLYKLFCSALAGFPATTGFALLQWMYGIVYNTAIPKLAVSDRQEWIPCAARIKS